MTTPPKNKNHEGHETTDMDFRIPWVLTAIITVSVLFALLITFGVLKLMSREARKNDPEVCPMSEGRVLPPEPRLQVNESLDLKQIQAADTQVLSNYAWVDRPTGLVRIPIEQAMEMTVSQGLNSKKEKTSGS